MMIAGKGIILYVHVEVSWMAINCPKTAILGIDSLEALVGWNQRNDLSTEYLQGKLSCVSIKGFGWISIF